MLTTKNYRLSYIQSDGSIPLRSYTSNKKELLRLVASALDSLQEGMSLKIDLESEVEGVQDASN